MVFYNNKICIISDIHLGIHQNNPNWHNIAIQYAQWLATTLRDEGIEDIMFCGDWYHHRDEINVTTIDVSAKILHILRDFNIVMIPGNHDCFLKNVATINSLSILKNSKNITIFDNLTTREIFGKTVSFVPWGIPVEAIPQSDVVFGHFELANFKINNFKVCDHGEDYNLLLAKTPLVFTGHFHLNQERVFDNGKIIYVGNTFQMDFGDAERSKFVYFYDFKTNIYESVENQISPKHILLKVSELEKHQNTLSTLTSGNIVRIYVDKKTPPEEVNKLSTQISQYKPIGVGIEYETNFDKVDMQLSRDIELKSIDVGAVIDEFISLMDIDNKAQVSKYVSDLYKSCLR